MGSSFHYTIDLNEDQIDQPLFYPLHHNNHQHDHHHHHYHHHVPSNISSSSSSLTSPSLSHLPFLINSHQDQLHVRYNNNTFHGILDPHLSQSLETKKFVSNGGSPISSDQVVPKKDTRLKLTIRKKDNHHEQVKLMKRKRLMITITDNNKQHVNNDQSLNQRNFEGDHHDHLKKVSTNQYNTIFNETGYEGGNNCVIRICSDCNTTKTPLWRSGPRGPKSLCNACGIRQRKARQAAVAAAAATTNSEYLSPPLLKKKMQRKNKRSNEVSNLSSPLAPKVKKGKSMTTSVMEGATSGDLENQGKSTVSSSSASSSSNKFYYDDLAVILSKSSAYQQVFPQDEKEAAILLMALSYGMVHG